MISAEPSDAGPVQAAIAESGAAEPTPADGEASGVEDVSPEEERLRDLTAQHGVEVAKAIQGGTVLKDMTVEQVRLARGEPDRKEAIPPDAELWHYPGGEVAFSAGKVTYVSLAPKRESAALSAERPLSGGTKEPASPPRLDGEPPARVEMPTIRVGDTYVYESVDPANPDASLSTRRTVTDTRGKIVLSSLNLDNPRAKPRILHFDQEWNLIASRSPNGSGRDYGPPVAYFDFPLFPGKTWQQTTTETDIKSGGVRIHTVSGIVKGWETISVPAGTFRGIRVELETELYDPSTGERIPGTDVSWYVPEVRRSVRSLTSGKAGSERIIRLLSYELK